MDTVVITPSTATPFAATGQLVTLIFAVIGAAIVFGMIIGNRRKNAARRAL